MSTFDRRDVARLLGPVADHTIVELVSLDARLEDLELAALRLAQEDDVLSEARKPLAGAAAQIIDIVTRDALYAEEPERGGKSA